MNRFRVTEHKHLIIPFNEIGVITSISPCSIHKLRRITVTSSIHLEVRDGRQTTMSYEMNGESGIR